MQMMLMRCSRFLSMSNIQRQMSNIELEDEKTYQFTEKIERWILNIGDWRLNLLFLFKTQIPTQYPRKAVRRFQKS